MNNNVEKSLKVAIVLTSAFFVVEIAGGLVSGSLSLLGDAGHMLRDVFALMLSLGAISVAKRLLTKTKTFGYHRIEILAALMNGILLMYISVWILTEAYHRFFTPQPVKSTTMFTVALIGLLVNLYVAFKLHGSHDLNIRSAFLHVLTDTLSSVAVIFASIWIFLTGQSIVDPILAMAIAVVILISAFIIVRDSIRVFLEFAPKNVEFDKLIRDIESVKGVESIHDVHLWSLCSNINILDAHIFTTETNVDRVEEIKREIKKCLRKYNVKHATLEFEWTECSSGEICKLNH